MIFKHTDITLNEDQQDCLQELMNIAYGSATAAISNILNSFATLSVPKISIIETKDLKNYLRDNIEVETSHYISSQILNGKIAGESLFIIGENSSKNMAREFGLEEDEINEYELCDVILEITNILSSATISKLAQEMNTTVSFSPPHIHLLQSIEKFDNKYLDKYQKVIVIKTQLKFINQNINAELLLLTTDNSIIFIKNTLDKLLEDFQ